MWEINNSLQLIALFRAFVLGGIFCLIYDFLRALRKQGLNSDFAVFIEDVIYFILITPITFCYLLALTNGELRGYFFASLLSGFLAVRFTISKLFLKLYLNLIFIILKFFYVIKIRLNKIFRFLSCKLSILLKFLSKIYLKAVKCFKKLLKKRYDL